jgi:ubiquitin-protein ligase
VNPVHADYEKAMRGLLVEGLDLADHQFKLESKEAEGASAVRMGRELRQMRTSLPVSFSSSVLVRHDKSRPYFMKVCGAVLPSRSSYVNYPRVFSMRLAVQALIFGPEDTPYDSGAFVFDIHCTSAYPGVPPRVKFKTTGTAAFVLALLLVGR